MTKNLVSYTPAGVTTVGGPWKIGQDPQATHSTPDRLTRRSRTPIEASSDEELLQLIADREPRAMEVLFARHSVRVFRFALSITRDRSLAEDVVSDVFFDIWRRPGSFEGRSQVSTWLLAIARNKALSSLQRHGHEQLNEEFADTLEDATDDPEVAMQRKQAGTVLAGCLLQLSRIHREIVDLVYYHHKSIEEAAEILNVPRSTVKTRMFYARKHLAEMLAVMGDVRMPLLS